MQKLKGSLMMRGTLIKTLLPTILRPGGFLLAKTITVFFALITFEEDQTGTLLDVER